MLPHHNKVSVDAYWVVAIQLAWWALTSRRCSTFHVKLTYLIYDRNSLGVASDCFACHFAAPKCDETSILQLGGKSCSFKYEEYMWFFDISVELSAARRGPRSPLWLVVWSIAFTPLKQLFRRTSASFNFEPIKMTEVREVTQATVLHSPSLISKW